MKFIKLVFLIALKQEVPDFLLGTKGCALVSLKALLAGDYRVFDDETISVLGIITGVGCEASILAATWVVDHLKPYQVINLGSAGSQSHQLIIGDLVMISSVITQEHSPIACLDRVPVLGTNVMDLPLVSLGSVQQLGDIIESDVVDMEAFWQADRFIDSSIAFTSLKYITDNNDDQTRRDVFKHFVNLRHSFNVLFQPLVDALSHPLAIDITVIIPTYNRATFILRAVESVLAQTYDCRCLVVDDGSTDDTLDQLAVFQDKIDVLCLSHNQGVSEARNQGVLAAKTNWIAFLDSDDVWTSSKLAKQVDYLNHHPLFEIMQCDENWFRNGKQKCKKFYHHKQEGWFFQRSLERCLISPSAVLISKRLFCIYHGFNNQFPACEDYDLWCRITRDYPVGFNNDIGVDKYAGHHDQLSELPFLDQYRLKTLGVLADQEKNIIYQLFIKKILFFKQCLVKKGKLKRIKV